MGFGTIHKGATGLLAFSRGLDVLSNNIANLNTPGYKRSDVLFRELFYQFQLTGDNAGGASTSQLGNGVTTRGTLVSFAQGDLQETGNSTEGLADVAINGNGFFILRRDDAVFYTRSGRFQFDEDGFLISPELEARVAGIDASGNLVDINIADLRVNPAQATTEINLFRNLARGATAPYVIQDVPVFDSLGASHNLDITFTNNSSVTSGSWLVMVEDEDGNDLTTAPVEIRFATNGSPVANFNRVNFNFQPAGTAANTITLFFGEPGSLTAATSLSGGTTSSLAVQDQDGRAAGTVLDLSFAEDGTLELRYTNEETAEAGQLALAWFDQLQTLRQLGEGLFLAPDDIRPRIAAPREDVMGNIVGGSLEISNVELTQEFTELIIMQRGYQASSQVVTVANEMIQQLLDAGKGR